MANICLITASTVTDFWGEEELNSNAVRSSVSEPQLGLLTLAAVLEERGDKPELIDLNTAYLRFSECSNEADARGFPEAAATEITKNDAAVYGLSSICSSYPLTIQIAKAIKARRPRCRLLLGGPQASVVDIPTLTEFPFIDFVLRGEAERSLPLLLEEIAGGGRFKTVPGLTYRRGTQIHRTDNAPVIGNLDEIPFPAYHLSSYLNGAASASLELGRGCPFACTFCSTNDFFRRNFRLRSPDCVLRDMRTIAARYSIRNFSLVHDMFTIDKRRVASFCESMIASKEEFTWACSARTDCVDEELLELMARAGCRGIFFGIETGSERMQRIIDKHLDVKRAEEVVDIAERLGISTTVALIAGFPEETWDDVRQTLSVVMHAARHIHADPQLNILAPLAGTPVYTKHKDELVLERLCSDMSHQGRRQNAADFDLIQEHLEIFPNFYLLPIPHLDRNTLFELHEFISIAIARFRWLAVAIDQTAMEILDFFLEWRTYRQASRPGLESSELRHYYRTRDFRTDFLCFVHEHTSASQRPVEALIEYEVAMSKAPSVDAATHNAPVHNLTVIDDAPPALGDVPLRAGNTRVVELSWDIQRVIDALKLQNNSPCERGTYFYVTREVSASKCRLVGISNWMACLLRACDGSRSVGEVAARLSADIPELDESVRDYACVRLLQGARSQGFIGIYRALPAQTTQAV